MAHIINKPKRKLGRVPQPPLSYPGATADRDRAKPPALIDPPDTDQDLAPGDRVAGLGDFGRLTGEVGTVQQTNEDDAVIQWDGDGRKRVHQPSLAKL
jgi:CheY-like chemotaxis protein